MDPKKWSLIKELFAKAKNLPEKEQASYVQQNSNGDPELIDSVLQMLRTEQHTQDEINLSNVVAASASTVLNDESVLQAGDMVERFEVVRAIGEGGMGSVVLAKRVDDDFEQLVAIKVIHRKHISAQSVQRFRRERQILASLNHKNIASFIGGGETKNGQPYIILEFVDGVPITEYCQQQEFSLEQRIELFKQVLEAVIYAHQNLIVHRDIKPNNVLVNAQGEVKLLDFGIAKIVQDAPQSDPANIELTQEFARVLTPANASPEQVLGSNITTRSDVYGLGALLMYLLTDEAVFDTTASSHRSIESMILDTLPARPSVKCAASTDEKVQRRAKELKGDLDTIVMKALQKEPERRYSSTEQLLEDIIRHQRNYPISAKPDSLRYRATKFIKRNTISTSLVGLFLVGLITTGIIIIKQSSAIQEERDVALRQAFIAQETAKFMTNIFSAADPNNHDGETISVREVLDSASKDIENLKSEPLIRAQLNTTLATVYSQIGEYDLAMASIENAEKHLAQSTQSKQTIGNIALKYQLGNEKGSLMIHIGEYDQALAIFSSLAEDLKNDPPVTLGSQLRDRYYFWFQYGLGSAYSYSGRDVPAVLHYKNSLARIETMLASGDDDMDDLMGTLPSRYFGLGHSLRRTGKHLESQKVLQRGIEIEKSLQRPPNLDLAHGLNQLADTFLTLGESEKAEKFALEGLAIRQKIHEYGHIEIIASIGILSNIYSKQKDYARSIEMRKEMLLMLAKAVGEEHPYYSSVQHALGSLYILINDFDTAQIYLDAAYQNFSSSFPDGHKYVAQALVTLGDLALRKEQLPLALEYLSSALKMLADKAPEPTQLMAKANAFYATALYNNSQSDEAITYEEQALDIIENLFGKESSEYTTLFKRIESAK